MCSPRTGRRLGYRILGVALVVGLFGWWPVSYRQPGAAARVAASRAEPGNYGTVEFTWRGLELIIGNYYVLTLLVFISATACALVLNHRLSRVSGPQSAPEPDAVPAARPPGIAR